MSKYDLEQIKAAMETAKQEKDTEEKTLIEEAKKLGIDPEKFLKGGGEEKKLTDEEKEKQKEDEKEKQETLTTDEVIAKAVSQATEDIAKAITQAFNPPKEEKEEKEASIYG